MKKNNNSLKDFYILWSTQSLSQLGSSMTGFALTLWLYEMTGSALGTAALSICTYTPYVLMSIFAGALTDRFDKKKTMLICDSLAALTTVMVYLLYRTDSLMTWHLYTINFISGLMNTVQQPASEVAYTLIIPKECYQRTGGLQSLSRSVISIANPLIASALYGMTGLGGVIAVDLASFIIAFVALLCFIRLSDVPSAAEKKDSTVRLVKEGIQYLRKTPLILHVILFMAGVNLISSAFDAVLPAMVIPRAGNGMLGIVTSCAGIAMIIGSVIASVIPTAKDRVRVIYLSMIFSLGSENFLLAFSKSPVVWCIAQILGWLLVPVMSNNQNIIMRNTIPVSMQGRIFACRNTLQFFTIPIGMALGGFMVDKICEPFMAANQDSKWLTMLFGNGKGSGAALMMLILGVSGSLLCLISGKRLKKYHYTE